MTTPVESPWKDSDPAQRVGGSYLAPEWLKHCRSSFGVNVKRKSRLKAFLLGVIVAVLAMILAAKIFPSFFLQLL